jgi:hypothetical protein
MIPLSRKKAARFPHRSAATSIPMRGHRQPTCMRSQGNPIVETRPRLAPESIETAVDARATLALYLRIGFKHCPL